MNNNEKLFLLIGLSSHLKGYKYILMSINEIDSEEITTIYNNISLQCHTTPYAVERNIRSAIEYCYSYGNYDLLNKICLPTYNQSRPSNKKFIAALKQYICYNE